MDVSFTNYTEFGIHNTGVRYTWALYHFVIILSSLIGDSVILVASIKYNAFKLHKAIVAIMQHLAVCDIISSLTLIHNLISTIAGWNILGSFFCYAHAYITYYCFPTSFCLTAALTTTKALMLQFPFQGSGWTKMRAHLVCGGIWIYSLSLPLLMFSIDEYDVIFDYQKYTCYYKFSSDPAWKFWLPVSLFLSTMLPTIIVIVTTVWLIIQAKKVVRRNRDTLRWQGLTTVILTAVVYCLSVLPITVYYFAGDYVKFHLYFFRFSASVVFITVVANFFIYSLTVNSFREFLFSRLTLLRKSVCGGIPESLGEQKKATKTPRGQRSDTLV